MKKERGQAVTEKILDTADRLFYFQGYNNTGINQVIEEADIARGSLYKHFESKSDLLLAYVERTHYRWFERLKTAVESITDPKLRLLALFDHHLERQHTRKYGGCPFIKANDEIGAGEPKVLAEIQKTKSEQREYIRSLVCRSGHRGILTDRELAETIYFLLEGAIAAGGVFKKSAELESAKKIVQKLI